MRVRKRMQYTRMRDPAVECESGMDAHPRMIPGDKRKWHTYRGIRG
jgi:hypothetical protein